jgi:xanthine/uracil permease
MDSHVVLALFHLVIIAPFLLFIGFKRADTPQWVYMALFAVGIIILLYHSFRLFTRLRSGSTNAWINAIHVLLVAPLLLYIGYHKKETPRSAYELLLLLAFGAGGYHLFSLVKMLDAHKE